MAETRGAAWRRRLYHFGRHPLAWAQYVYEREVRHRDVRFAVNPRFRDWRPMFEVALPALAHLTGAPPGRLRAYFDELAPLHRELYTAIGALPSAGAMMQAPLLYVFVRAVRPSAVVETGVSSGYSARLLLEGLARNERGTLWSIGIQKIAVGQMPEGAVGTIVERPVGWLVPERLRSRWNLRVGASEDLLPGVLADEAKPLEIFIHDSLHLYDRMTAEYTMARPRLVPGGWLFSHDIHNNRAWPDFLSREHLAGDEELDHDLGAVRMPAG
ncbi:MAG TPA: class I SAM-dependent methyltransferase [Thermoplasmata archaeon]|nr:class I SAM-dependent methyltransferase [Thermoplasmata archaeon]